MGKLRDWVASHQATFRRLAHMLEAVTLMALMVGGGAGAGYALCQWQFRDLMAQQREDHQAEIGRLQAAYSQTLEALTPKVSQAAGAAAEAAEASGGRQVGEARHTRRPSASTATTAHRGRAQQGEPRHRGGKPEGEGGPKVRSILLFLMLAGCAVPAPPAAAPPPRDCATLPTLMPGAGRAEMLNHIRVTADLYARCAAMP